MRVSYITPQGTSSNVTIPDYVYVSLVEYAGSDRTARKAIRDATKIIISNGVQGKCLSQTVAGAITTFLIDELSQEAQILRTERDALQASLLGAASILLEGAHVG